MNKELWKDIPGYEGLYQVSSLGRVRSLNFNHHGYTKILKQSITPRGYRNVSLWKNGIHKVFGVHRLIAMTFIPNPNNLPEVNHKDENTSNNCITNLEWCSSQYNNTYGTNIQRRSKKLLKPIACYKNNKLIKQYKSLKEAVIQNGYSYAGLSLCLHNHRKTYKGYEWNFI